MSTSGTELREALAQSVSVSDEALVADLADGRTITVPLAWFPRLAHGTPTERANWRLMAGGEGIHWPELDEDISVESLWRAVDLARPRSLFVGGSSGGNQPAKKALYG